MKQITRLGFYTGLVACLSVATFLGVTAGALGADMTIGNAVLAQATSSPGSGTSAPTYLQGRNTTTQATTTATSTAEGEEDEFVLTRRDISDAGSSPADPMNVTTADDFAAYARSLMRLDENVTRIEATDDRVALSHKERGELIGVIPVTFSLKASIAPTGDVTIEYPWWHKVFARSADAGGLESDLESTAGAIARAEAETTFSSNTKARLVNALYSVMKTNYASGSDTGTTTSEAEAE